MKTIKETKLFSEKLLEWYGEEKRDLPWRHTSDPYHIWVSEIMLQQTRVEAVIPYYKRFINQIPSISALAKASDDQLHVLWQGLGYYSRVQNMKKAAIVCVQKYDGKLPMHYDELLSLPGIGSYSAAAIASIGYHQCYPAVDGNVMRVCSRLFLFDEDIIKEKSKKQIRELLFKYIDQDHPDTFNQAMIELGALICIPNPRCNICPISSLCHAYKQNKILQYPKKKQKTPRKIQQVTIVILECNGSIHIQRREKGLLKGLYEFETLYEYYTKKQLLSLYQSYDIQYIKRLSDKIHIFTHIEWHMQAYWIQVKNMNEGIWKNKQTLLDQYAIPCAYLNYLQEIMKFS